VNRVLANTRAGARIIPAVQVQSATTTSFRENAAADRNMPMKPIVQAIAVITAAGQAIRTDDHGGPLARSQHLQMLEVLP